MIKIIGILILLSASTWSHVALGAYLLIHSCADNCSRRHG